MQNHTSGNEESWICMVVNRMLERKYSVELVNEKRSSNATEVLRTMLWKKIIKMMYEQKNSGQHSDVNA